jgi:tyrosine-protein kinase Etk/Wzc
MNRPKREDHGGWSAQDEYEDQVLTLRDYVGIALQSWKLILFSMLLAGFIGLYVAWGAAPVYQANALIQIEDKSGVPLTPKLDPTFAYNAEQSPSAAEIEILGSRSVLQNAVKELKLDISVTPHYFGAIGAALARTYEPRNQPADPPLLRLADYLGLDPHGYFGQWLRELARYAWGGERIRVSRLGVPRELKGQELALVAGKDGAYRVEGPAGGALLQGKVGKAARGKTARGAPLEMYVAELTARKGTEFLLTKWSMHEAVQHLQDSLQVVERGTDTGIVELTLEAPSPQAAKKRLNAIANAYLKQNIARESEEAHKRLEFVNRQLPRLRARVNATEKALRAYQAKRGTVNLSLEARTLLNKLTRIEAQISKLGLKQTEMGHTYTESYPLMVALQSRQISLQQDLVQAEQQLKNLPNVESDYLKLARNAQVQNKLYLSLLNRAQELKVLEVGVNGYARIIDPAFAPLLPSGPHRLRAVLIAVVLGLMCAMGLLLLRRTLTHALETPDPIERKLGIPVYATIPHSRNQAKLGGYKEKKGGNGQFKKPRVLARCAGADNAIEGLRSLRTSPQFALLEAKNNVVAITSATPKLGKTFVTVNLAFLLADIGKRVLLIDGDLRHGDTHRYMGWSRLPGLSDVIAGRCELEHAIHVVDGVHFISTGTLPPNPSELLADDGFGKIIEAVSQRFDVVVIDTPPILNLADGIIIARRAGTNFLVVRSGYSTLDEVEFSVRRLQQNDIKLSGVIFNGLNVNATKYGYGRYSYYAYNYKPAKAEP